MRIDEATEADLPAILAIHNDVVATSTAIYSDIPSTLADRATWRATRQAAGYPVLVAREAGEVLGFASFGDFRAGSGYAATVEHSIHVRADARRRGVGRALLSTLPDRAKACGKHVLIGGIDADNQASLSLHAALGFERVAHFRQVGRKFGRWLDLVFVQKIL
ncbi:MAG: N-acetyltransferase family protein [Phenylobacterium sp.]|uniref:GNAT family N-acetyltransferase n=1 Tax=Phenylobacterium sp. TaxID=1871053 RepID=UPI0011FB44C6|nr:GNAT family N-acetyltransferase [Phenylobacterium sp.]TAL35115.1 MAG: N-acetyltransferase family protein [Phenylobacterium sp.]